MPTITNKFSAHLVDKSSVRVSWAEVDLQTSGGGSVFTKLDSYLRKNDITVSVSLDADLISSDTVGQITTTLDAAITVPTSRDITTSLAQALDDPEVEIFFAIDLEFDSGELNLWSGLGDKVIGGKTYVGTGQLLSISDVEETSQISAAGATISLSGIPSTLLALALTEPYQGRICTIYFGVISDTTEMTEVFSGFMDQMNIIEGADTSTIDLAVENKLIDLERPRVARYTSAYQKSIYPDDKGMDFIEDLQDKRLTWGRKPAE